MHQGQWVRANIVPIVVVGGPIASWAIALGLLHGDGSGLLYALLFGVLPFVAALGAAYLAGNRTASLPAAILSAAIGVVSWLAVALHFARLSS